MMNNNIEKIIASGELLDYIRGEKRYKNIRPEVDYTRWHYVSDYLMGSGKPNVKDEIVSLLIELLESKDWHDVYAVAGICLDIDTPDVDKELEQMILDAKFFSLPDPLVSFTSKYAMKKRLNSVSKSVVENAINKNHIDWVVTLISQNTDEQEAYWSYCDKIIGDVLSEVGESEKVQTLEKVSFWKNKTMAIIHQINERR